MSKRKKRRAPTVAQLEAELAHERYRRRYRSALRSTVCTLVTVAAIAVLAATLWLPVLQVYGSSMSPTLQSGEIVIAVRAEVFEPGDVIAFYSNNKLLVKRVICAAGDQVDIDESGNVFVNDVALSEPYLTEKALGECDIELPYQVPEGRLFVMGDQRTTSADSRNTAVGCVAQEQIVGKVKLRIWPLDRIEWFD